MKIQMLGTGNAMATKCYNTCFLIENNRKYVLVDAGGGNEILRRLEAIDFDYQKFHHMIVTHAHTDHILGVIWIIRKIASLILANEYSGNFHIYCHDEVAQILPVICKFMLASKMVSCIGDRIIVDFVDNGMSREINGCMYTFFDICSTKMKQYGFAFTTNEHKKVVCLGDEPYNMYNQKYVQGADWMMCEAFCLYADREKYKPYEKHHSTALDAGKLAENLNVRNLLLYHTEDDHLSNRKEAYGREARMNFNGNVFVPDDMEVIEL